MSEIYLVRHAQASFGEGNYDRLSALGHKQSTWLGEYFKYRDIRFDRIICGDMVRHHQTLDGICEAMGLNSADRQAHSHWNEFDFEALVAAYLKDHPDEVPDKAAPVNEFTRLLRKTMQAWASDSLPEPIPETWSEFEQRVQTGLSRASTPFERGSRTLVVTSGGAIAMAIRQVLCAPREAMIQMNIQNRNSSFSHLYFNQDSMQLAGFNHIPHLEHPGRVAAVTYF